jgi:hypothetical protein
VNRSREPFLKGVSLHNPVSCERESSMLTQGTPERGRQPKAVRCTVRLWVRRKANKNCRTGGNSKGNRKAAGTECRIWSRSATGFAVPTRSMRNSLTLMTKGS